MSSRCFSSFFFFNDTATTEIYTLSLHDALPISYSGRRAPGQCADRRREVDRAGGDDAHHRRVRWGARSEEHTSELQSRLHLVCRLLLEKKKKKTMRSIAPEAQVVERGSLDKYDS